MIKTLSKTETLELAMLLHLADMGVENSKPGRVLGLFRRLQTALIKKLQDNLDQIQSEIGFIDDVTDRFLDATGWRGKGRHIRSGALKAKRRGTGRTERQGGDMWYIKDRDIREFLIENVHALNFRKLDKYWFTDLVAGRGI